MRNNALNEYLLGQAGWSTGSLINALGQQNSGHTKT